MPRPRINKEHKVIQKSFNATRNQLKIIGGGNAKEGWRKLKIEHEKTIKRLIEGEGEEV
jgi:hypothetical protein